MMIPPDFAQLAHQCAPQVHLSTMQTIVRTESSFNPYAIAIVSGTKRWHLSRQPRNHAEAVATANSLVARGVQFSAGYGQIFQGNFARFGFTTSSVFNPCENLRAAAQIYTECVERARRSLAQGKVEQDSMSLEQRSYRHGLSCYYSGNFKTGYREGYVLAAVKNALHAQFTGKP